MRAVIVGAVESTRTALRTVAGTAGWSVAALMTLPPSFAARHSDFADMTADAANAGAELIHCADSNAPEAVAAIARLAADVVFVIGWSQICRPAFRAAAGDRVVGYHPAALPRLRGRGVLPWTILLGEPMTAGSLFWIDDGVDSGAILSQHEFSVGADETVTSLYARHLEVLAAMLAEALPRIAAGDPPRRLQDEALATWAARRVPDDGVIDWQRPADEIARLVRAVTHPYPGAFTTMRDERLTVWATGGRDGRHHAAVPGQVVAVDADRSFLVRCGCGDALRVTVWNAPSQQPPTLHSRLRAE